MGMNTKVQQWCVWSGPAALVLYVAAFWFIGQYIPPHPPSLSADQVWSFYDLHRNQIRIGQLLSLIFSTLFFPWFAVISVQMARIEGRFPVLSVIQFGGGALLIVFFQICSMIWTAAAFRPELDPTIVRMMHDTSWLIFVMVFPSYTLQMICISVVGLSEKSATPTWPRWACFFNLWVGVSAIGGGFATFFKIGPFAWNGLFGFWVPVILFVLWIAMTTPLLLKSIQRQAQGGT